MMTTPDNPKTPPLMITLQDRVLLEDLHLARQYLLNILRLPPELLDDPENRNRVYGKIEIQALGQMLRKRIG